MAMAVMPIVASIMTIVIAVIIMTVFGLQTSERQERACHSQQEVLPHLISH